MRLAVFELAEVSTKLGDPERIDACDGAGEELRGLHNFTSDDPERLLGRLLAGFAFFLASLIQVRSWKNSDLAIARCFVEIPIRALRDVASPDTRHGAGPVAPTLPLAPADGSPAVSRASSTPTLGYRVPQQASIDGNTVELDRERANFADNSVRYEATLRFINGGVRTMLSAIRGE